MWYTKAILATSENVLTGALSKSFQSSLIAIFRFSLKYLDLKSSLHLILFLSYGIRIFLGKKYVTKGFNMSYIVLSNQSQVVMNNPKHPALPSNIT